MGLKLVQQVLFMKWGTQAGTQTGMGMGMGMLLEMGTGMDMQMEARMQLELEMAMAMGMGMEMGGVMEMGHRPSLRLTPLLQS